MSSSSTLRTILRNWTNISASTISDDSLGPEAQIISGTYTRLSVDTPLPQAMPLSSRSHQSRVRSFEEGTDPINDFFEVTSPRTGTQDSRHDSFVTIFHSYDVPPPPYADASDLPSYDAVVEPPTLAMYMFKFGFFFPLFWFAGIIILLSPLSAPEGWEPLKTEEEREEMIELLRRAEKKWAKRCLLAFIVFIFLAIIITTIVVLAFRA